MEEKTIVDHCPNCNALVTWMQAGRFLLPTEDGTTNHFLSCPPLRQEIEHSPRRGRRLLLLIETHGD